LPARLALILDAAAGMAIAGPAGVRVLEARFHPFERESPTFVVVGHVVWDDGDAKRAPRVEATAALGRHTGSKTILATLKHLVHMTSPQTFERLQALRSRFWSFASVPTPSKEKPST
jgi:hypothetical protein